MFVIIFVRVVISIASWEFVAVKSLTWSTNFAFVSVRVSTCPLSLLMIAAKFSIASSNLLSLLLFSLYAAATFASNPPSAAVNFVSWSYLAYPCCQNVLKSAHVWSAHGRRNHSLYSSRNSPHQPIAVCPRRTSCDSVHASQASAVSC